MTDKHEHKTKAQKAIENLIDQERVEAWGLCAAATCEYSQEDGCCGHPDAARLTPECHEWCCVRLRK